MRSVERATEYPHGQAGGKGLAQFRAAGAVRGGNALRGGDLLRRLGVGEDDQGWGDGLEPPAGEDSRQLAGGPLAIGAGTDQARAGTSVEASQEGIVGPVEEVLHQAAEAAQGFRGRKDVAVGGQKILGGGCRGLGDAGRDSSLRCGAACRGIGHLGGAARHGLVDDEELLRGCHGSERVGQGNRLAEVAGVWIGINEVQELFDRYHGDRRFMALQWRWESLQKTCRQFRVRTKVALANGCSQSVLAVVGQSGSGASTSSCHRSAELLAQ